MEMQYVETAILLHVLEGEYDIAREKVIDMFDNERDDYLNALREVVNIVEGVQENYY